MPRLPQCICTHLMYLREFGVDQKHQSYQMSPTLTDNGNYVNLQPCHNSAGLSCATSPGNQTGFAHQSPSQPHYRNACSPATDAELSPGDQRQTCDPTRIPTPAYNLRALKKNARKCRASTSGTAGADCRLLFRLYGSQQSRS